MWAAEAKSQNSFDLTRPLQPYNWHTVTNNSNRGKQADSDMGKKINKTLIYSICCLRKDLTSYTKNEKKRQHLGTGCIQETKIYKPDAFTAHRDNLFFICENKVLEFH